VIDEIKRGSVSGVRYPFSTEALALFQKPLADLPFRSIIGPTSFGFIERALVAMTPKRFIE
jgi:hypothetical protein